MIEINEGELFDGVKIIIYQDAITGKICIDKVD